MSLHDPAQAAALRTLIEAVERHQLSSADLPAYLAGYNIDGEIADLARQWEPLKLSSKELLKRLRALKAAP